jgi:hypothetical protein
VRGGCGRCALRHAGNGQAAQGQSYRAPTRRWGTGGTRGAMAGRKRRRWLQEVCPWERGCAAQACATSHPRHRGRVCRIRLSMSHPSDRPGDSAVTWADKQRQAQCTQWLASWRPPTACGPRPAPGLGRRQLSPLPAHRWPPGQLHRDGRAARQGRLRPFVQVQA